MIERNTLKSFDKFLKEEYHKLFIEKSKAQAYRDLSLEYRIEKKMLDLKGAMLLIQLFKNENENGSLKGFINYLSVKASLILKEKKIDDQLSSEIVNRTKDIFSYWEDL